MKTKEELQHILNIQEEKHKEIKQRIQELENISKKFSSSNYELKKKLEAYEILDVGDDVELPVAS